MGIYPDHDEDYDDKPNQEKRRFTVDTNPCTNKESAVSMQLGLLDKATAELHSCIDRIEERLASVSSPKANAKDECESASPATNVANRIEQCTTSIRRASSHLDDIMDRLEI